MEFFLCFMVYGNIVEILKNREGNTLVRERQKASYWSWAANVAGAQNAEQTFKY